jgi:two-component sensor histidine kinase
VQEQHREATSRLPLFRGATSDILALVAVIRRVSLCHSINEVMETVTPAARLLLKADGITFVLREGDDCFYAEEDSISPLWKGKRFPLHACISGWCMLEKRSAAIEDIYSDPRIPHDAYRPTFVQSLAMVPVRQDDPIAALGAYWRLRRPITPGEIELLQAIANAAGLAVANIELSEQRESASKARKELGHRIRNMLSVVDVMARQTLRTTKDPEEFRSVFSARLQALGNAQNMLDGRTEGSTNIRALIEEQVLLGHDTGRILYAGPDVSIGPDEAFDLALALHELGTNARKHGALSAEHGAIAIDWKAEQEANDSWIVMTWVEHGGPPVETPETTGFGSALIRSAFKKNGGGTEIEFQPSGLICRMRFRCQGHRTSRPSAE